MEPIITAFRERRIANCAGHIVTSNCGGDSFWEPANGNWWTYPGIGGSAGNRTATAIMTGQTQSPNQGVNNPTGGFDFSSRSTSDTALTQFGVKVYGSYTLVETRDNLQIWERTVNNCNCGNNNCITNCACVCVCVCACDCACSTDSSCIIDGSLVEMAGGSTKRVENLVPGDTLASRDGTTSTVVALHRVRLGRRNLMIVGDLILTADHPIMVGGAYFVGDLIGFQRTVNRRVVDRLDDGTMIRSRYAVSASQMDSPSFVLSDPETVVYCPVVEGADHFIANGQIVSALVVDKSVNQVVV